MGKLSTGKWESKVGGWRYIGTVNTGNKRNRLRLVAKGNLIMGFINGVMVGSFRDDSHKSGKIALMSERLSGNELEVYFDNVLAKEPLGASPQSLLKSEPKLTAKPTVEKSYKLTP